MLATVFTDVPGTVIKLRGIQECRTRPTVQLTGTTNRIGRKDSQKLFIMLQGGGRFPRIPQRASAVRLDARDLKAIQD